MREIRARELLALRKQNAHLRDKLRAICPDHPLAQYKYDAYTKTPVFDCGL